MSHPYKGITKNGPESRLTLPQRLLSLFALGDVSQKSKNRLLSLIEDYVYRNFNID